jgi:octanoyl-[GcvH]:protein N-octanoyltransferase
MSWQVAAFAEPVDPCAQLREEAGVFEQAAPVRAPRAWLWEPACGLLVVTRPETRLPRYASAVARLEAEGWPTWLRSSGGSAVPLAPGMLVLTQIEEVESAAAVLQQGFERLCDPLIAALAAFGLEVGTGPVAGAYCDGRFNLVCKGRKLAGTAQRQRRSAPDRMRIMAHAVVLIEARSRASAEAVYRFYEWAGAERHLDPASVTTVTEQAAAGVTVSLATVRARIEAVLNEDRSSSG